MHQNIFPTGMKLAQFQFGLKQRVSEGNSMIYLVSFLSISWMMGKRSMKDDTFI